MIPNLFPVLIHLPTYVGFYFLNTTQNNLPTRSLHFIPPPISPGLPSPAVPSLVVVVVVVARRGSCRARYGAFCGGVERPQQKGLGLIIALLLMPSSAWWG